VTISRLLYVTILVGMCALLAGCKPKPTQVPAATPAPAVIEGTPATEDECKEYGRKLEQAVNSKNQASVEMLISLEELAARCLSDLSMTGSQRQSIVQGVRAGVRKNALAAQLVSEVEQGGSFKLLRVHEVDGRARVMFRLIGTETGVKHFDFLLTRPQQGAITVEDIYVFTAGEMLTQTLRRILLPAVAELNQGSVEKLRGADRTFLNNMPKFQAMAEAIRADNKPEAIKIYNALPEEFRNQKVIVLLYMTAANGNDAEYSTSVELYRRLFPADAAVDFLSMEYFLLKKEYTEALRCIENYDKAIGGDPYMHVWRANVFLEAKRFKEARAASEKAIEQEPTLADAYWSRINLSLSEKNHVETLAWLKKLIEKTNEEVANLSTVAEYADFVKSPQHAEWVKSYATKKK